MVAVTASVLSPNAPGPCTHGDRSTLCHSSAVSQLCSWPLRFLVQTGAVSEAPGPQPVVTLGEGTDGVTGLKAAWPQVPTVWLLCSLALPGLLCLAPGFICEPGWDPSPHGGPHGSLLASEVKPQPFLTDSWPRARRAHGAAPSSLTFLPWAHESFPFFRSLEKHLDVRT